MSCKDQHYTEFLACCVLIMFYVIFGQTLFDKNKLNSHNNQILKFCPNEQPFVSNFTEFDKADYKTCKRYIHTSNEASGLGPSLISHTNTPSILG